MGKSIVASAFLAGAVATPAFAQDAGPADAGAAGFRIEAIGGIESTDFETGAEGEGFLYGLGVGFDVAAGRFRFGLEAEASDSTISDCIEIDLTDLCSRSGRDLYGGARAGGMISPSVLLYAKAGYTNMRVARSSIGPIVGLPPVVVRREYDGLRLGGGAELAVGRILFVKAEYRFSTYEANRSFDKHQGVVGFGLRF